MAMNIGSNYEGIFNHFSLNPDCFEKWKEYWDGKKVIPLQDKLAEILQGISGVRVVSQDRMNLRTSDLTSVGYIQIGFETQRNLRTTCMLIPRLFRRAKRSITTYETFSPIATFEDIRTRISQEEGLTYLIDRGANHLIYQGIVGTFQLNTLRESEPISVTSYERVVLGNQPLKDKYDSNTVVQCQFSH